MEFVVYLFGLELSKFVIIALAAGILILTLVIVLLSCYIMKLHRMMTQEENRFKRKLRREVERAREESKKEDDTEDYT